MVRAYVGTVLSLAGLTCALTWVYLAMRSVMEIGGSCAEGGPYVVAQPCPKGVEVTMLGGIFGGLICAALFAWFASKLGGGYGAIVLLAWPALFLSLGWNFWDFGLNPPGEDEGPAWGNIVCGVVFWLMGGLPLLALLGKGVARGLFWPPDRERDASGREKSPLVPDAVRSAVRRPARRSPESYFDGVNRPQPAASPPRAAKPAAPKEDVVSRLERLAALRDRGALDPEEYERAKKAVLDG